MKPNRFASISLLSGALLLLLNAQLAASSASERLSRSKPHLTQNHERPQNASIGEIERLHPDLDRLIAPGSTIERLDSGFSWSEGPVWDPRKKALLFSDVPQNVVFIWKEGVGTREFLKPSGYTGMVPGGKQGANGLTFDAQGRLVLCQHGDRQVARLKKDGTFETIAEYYRYRRFNSPNDLVFKSNGDLYFTDPPYGLPKGNQDPEKELPFNGVYRVNKKGDVTLLVRNLTFPNGIAFSPDEKTLYVAVSDPERAMIMAYAVDAEGNLDKGRVFFDATPMVKEKKGLPDGLKVDIHGNLFATGPGGVLVLSPNGTHLGTINTGVATANCAWGEDGSVLYITAHMHLCRIKTQTKGKLR